MTYGLRAGLVIIRNYITGRAPSCKGRPRNSIAAIIRSWAPPSENATQRYIDYVAGCVGVSQYAQIDFRDKKTIVDLVQAMCFVECGQQVERSLIESAYEMV